MYTPFMRMHRRTVVCVLTLLAGAALPVPAAEPVQGGSGQSLSRWELVRKAERIAREENLDERLVKALIQVESGFNPRAVSRRGALGLMQLMPSTARRLGVADPFDPEQNLRGGIRELRRLIDRYGGDIVLALAAYNAGEGAVAKYGGVPPYRETRGYIDRILTIYTGRPYRLGWRTHRPVHLLRDPASGAPLITNTGAAPRRPRRAPVLAGGFGR